MADGTTKKIEEINVLDQVMTAEGNTGSVNVVMTRYVNEPLVRVVAWGHSHLRMTANHPVLTRRGYVAAGELTPEDWIALPIRKLGSKKSIATGDHIKAGFRHQTSDKLRRMGYLGSLASQEKSIAYAIAALPATIQLTAGFGRIIGLYLAEGSACRGIVSWTFGRHERDTLVAELVGLLREELGIEAVLSERPHAIEVRTCGTIRSALFESLCGKGAVGKTIHPDLMNGSPEFLRAVLDGWLDGDGHNRGGRRIGTTVSHALAQDVFSIAQTLGLKPTITGRQPNGSRAPNGPGGELVPINASFAWYVAIADESNRPSPRGNSKHVGVTKHGQRDGYWIAWGSTSAGKPKNLGSFESEEEAAAVATQYRKDNKYNGVGRSHSEEGVVWRRVRRIEREPYSGYVFNLEVAGDNSYVSEGVGVHNCVVASKLHLLGLAAGAESGYDVEATDQEVLDQYFGICGPDDEGCIITDVLDVFRTRGMTANGRSYKIDGYVSIDWTSKIETQVALVLFGALDVGVNLPQAWTQDSIWDVPSGMFSWIVGGHCVLACDYDETGVLVSSWGRIYCIKWRAWLEAAKTWVEECYAVLSPLWYARDDLSPAGVDGAGLKADLAKLQGGILPELPDPNPQPKPPTPPVVPPSEGMPRSLVALDGDGKELARYDRRASS